MKNAPPEEVALRPRSMPKRMWQIAIALLLILLGAGAFHTRAQHGMIQEIKALGGRVATEPLGPQWLGRAGGWVYGPFLYRIASLDLREANLAENGLAILARLPNLRGLDLSGQPISDADLAKVAECLALRYLALDATPISDLGLQYLKGLRRLEILSLRDTQIYDESLSRPQWWPRLRMLRVEGTHITSQAVAKLRDARPGLVIIGGEPKTEAP